MNTSEILFIDLEVGTRTLKIDKVGALIHNSEYKGSSVSTIKDLYDNFKPQYICGHNFINHDKTFLLKTTFNPIFDDIKIIDTLFVSMLVYPDKVTHKLTKPYKIDAHIENDPLGDCVATKDLLEVMLQRYYSFGATLRSTLRELLKQNQYFEGFFAFVEEDLPYIDSYELFKSKIVSSRAEFESLLQEYPAEMGIILVYLMTRERTSLSYAVLHNFPKVVELLKQLMYQYETLDLSAFANNEFNISGFREFDARDAVVDLFGMDEKKVSQKDIIEATLQDKSILAILPTGGGKTFTFQMPALIKAQAYKSLTVIISPLQALMKNHVESFREKNQNFKVAAISGYLSPIERINAIAEVQNGIIDILYLAPEALRSNSIFNMLKKRIIERFVIDEAHCFSSWGHDFRHDYKYIATFIKELQEASPFQGSIPVSCLSATAKPEVLDDIKKYFFNALGLELEEFLASSKRDNLFYRAIEVADEKEKYDKLIEELLRIGKKPTIIYIPQNAAKCKELCEKLQQDPRIQIMNLEIEPFYSKIDQEIEDSKRSGRNKSDILNDFIEDKIDIVIATTAFGMGIDKPNIQAVLHYEISDSLESYLQESGRGGRSDNIAAECVVMYAQKDFDRLFDKQNRSKIEYSEINRILKEIKKEKRNPVVLSTKQIAERIGLDTEDSRKDYDVMIKTALLELEEHGIIQRGRNSTKIYATSVQQDQKLSGMELVHKTLDAHKDQLALYDEMIRVMSVIIGRSKLDPIEVDDLSEHAGVNRKSVHEVLYKLAEYKLIAMDNDISAHITKNVKKEIEAHFTLEVRLIEFLQNLPEYQHEFHMREFNDMFKSKNNNVLLYKKILQSFNHLSSLAKQSFKIKFHKDVARIYEKDRFERIAKLVLTRQDIAREVILYLLEKTNPQEDEIQFSSVELKNKISEISKVSLEGFHHTLVYMHDTLKEFKLRKGRLIYYQAFMLKKTERIQEGTPYQKRRDYNSGLKLYYERKSEAIHILREFFKMLSTQTWERSSKFINDYFSMEYEAFKKSYKFDEKMIKLPLTKERYTQIVENLNAEQKKVFDDKSSQAIMVLAGPGSGKTKTLVHKIASIITLENHKPEHFLMLTHGRAAANEFKMRLEKLIGNLAYGVDIMTFHAFALELIGRNINETNSLNEAIKIATQGLKDGSLNIPFKTMLILDEYQDVSKKTFSFVEAVFEKMEANKRIIAVGDDDQCINNFEGEDRADISYMSLFETTFSRNNNYDENDESSEGFSKYTLVSNYRSAQNIVYFANSFAQTIPDRLKANPLVSYNSHQGYIRITKYQPQASMFTKIVEDVIADPSEQIAILCGTNNDVLIVYSMLKAKNINVKYLTSKDGFKLGQLVELQDFLLQWKNSTFNEAQQWLETYYVKSSNLPLAKKVIERFLNEYNQSDLEFQFLLPIFEDYLYEIEFDEFEATKAKVIVSTMHKAKGKEFDSVYVMVNKNFIKNDYQRRLLYVAITRAKENLYIHTQDDCFQYFEVGVNVVIEVTQLFDDPNEILLTMGLKDISLGSEAAAKGIALTNPMAGEEVIVNKNKNSDNTYWFNFSKNLGTVGVLASVNGSKERVSNIILEKEAQGYRLEKSAIIDYVVRWKDSISNNEFDQLLCMIKLKKEI